MVYVRQSTAQQVLRHEESTRLQYGLAGRARQLGWPEERILVIDDDLGHSAAEGEHRAGFQRLVSEVSLDHVGMILGVEISRLARSSKDWHQLLEICALFGTLIADSDGICDPADFNDRMLLGLKGTMSEAELHVIKQRMHQGKINKARRGELGFDVPTGYVRSPSGEVTFDPDEEVGQVVELIFRKFEELLTVHALLSYLVAHDIRIGVRVRGGEGKGELQWRRSQPDDAAEHAQKPDLRRSLRLRQAPDRSPQEKARTALHGQDFALSGRVARPSQGSAAGLHKLADLREELEAVGGQPGGGRRQRRAQGWQIASAGAGGLRLLRRAHDTELPRQRQKIQLRLRPPEHRLRRQSLPVHLGSAAGRIRSREGASRL